jgi:hypothetical protein
MEGTEKPLMYKYKEITNGWNYDASCTLTSLPVWDLENFKCLVFVVQSVHQAFKINNYDKNQFVTLAAVVFHDVPVYVCSICSSHIMLIILK